MKNLMDVEPVLISNLVAAVIALAVAFNAPISQGQQQSIMALVAAIVAIFFGGAVVARNRVYSPATMRKIVHEVEAGEPVSR